jgi:hypothetical protein
MGTLYRKGFVPNNKQPEVPTFEIRDPKRMSARLPGTSSFGAGLMASSSSSLKPKASM